MNEPAPERGPVLLGLARRSLEHAFRGGTAWSGGGPRWLADPGAAFVTLLAGGELRGCVGTITPRRPLGEDVWDNARAAAFGDVRFSPLTATELPEVTLEVSELSPLEPLAAADEAAAAEALVPGVDGVLLAFGELRGIFLPQVWRHLTTPGTFLAELKRKAGLAPDFWSPELELWRFAVTEWREG